MVSRLLAAFVQRHPKLPPELMQFSNLESHLAQFLAKMVANRCTCSRPAEAKTEKFVDFLQRKSQLLHVTDKLESFDLSGFVVPKAARAAPRRRQQPSAFIETDGIDAEPALPRKLSDSHASPSRLKLYATTWS